SVILAGMPVTDMVGNPIVTSTAGTFSVRIGVRRLGVFAPPPGLLNVGAPFWPTVGLGDSRGDIVTGFPRGPRISPGPNPGGATRGGTLTATPSDGVALFSGLTLNQPGAGYTLQVSGAGLHTTTARIEATAGPTFILERSSGPTVVATPTLQDRGRLDQ